MSNRPSATAEAFIRAEATLRNAGISASKLDTQIIFEHVLGIERAYLLATDKTITKTQHKTIDAYIDRRSKFEPIAYIIGEKEFYGLSFKVNKDVLIPRPETERLVHYAVEHAPRNASTLELGTGSGCIAIALKQQRSDISMTATDISQSALMVAKENALTHKTDITFLHSDLFSNVAPHKYDVICANLPYVPTHMTHVPDIDYEPSLALYSGQAGLDLYSQFFIDAPAFLSSNGLLIIEHNPDQFEQLNALAKKHCAKALTQITQFISYL